MIYSLRSAPIMLVYKIDDTFLNYVTSIKHLGIIFDTHLNFVEHIQSVINKAYKMYVFMIRNCKCFRNIQALNAYMGHSKK